MDRFSDDYTGFPHPNANMSAYSNDPMMDQRRAMYHGNSNIMSSMHAPAMMSQMYNERKFARQPTAANLPYYPPGVNVRPQANFQAPKREVRADGAPPLRSPILEEFRGSKSKKYELRVSCESPVWDKL
jgi:hypothetical protein